MRVPFWSALLLAGALLVQCRHDPGLGGARAASMPGPPEPLDVPSLRELRGQRLEQLRVSEDGSLLFTRWALSAEGVDHRVVHLPDGRPVWSGKGIPRNGLWTLELSPEGSAGFVFLPFEPDSSFILFRVSGAPIPMTDVEFTGGAWARGGGWFGGSSGAFNADGTRRGKAVPDWLKVEEELFLPGSRPDTLRYMHDDKVMEWDGQGPPTVVGAWHCSQEVKRHRLSPSRPVRFSPDGRYIVWVVQATNALTVCDGNSGVEFELAPRPAPAAWVDERHLWWIDEGALVGMDVLTREKTPRLPLPDGAKAVSLSASLWPPALFVGTDEGRLFRLPLTGSTHGESSPARSRSTSASVWCYNAFTCTTSVSELTLPLASRASRPME